MQDSPQGERAIFDVEHIQTGDHLRAVRLSDVCDWMMAAGQPAEPTSTLLPAEAHKNEGE